VAKRSPILGYNHNVLYRGLVFHVQTEDSGLLSPHLFTHLFHGGVILSTRKLVYDAGSAEESIKGLMQSQHKIVLKDLKRGAFDDKIDQYLAGTPGLLPRAAPAGAPPPAESPVPAAAEAIPAAAEAVPAAAEAAVPQATDRLPTTRTPRPQTEELETLEPVEPIELLADRPSEPVITIEHGSQGSQPIVLPRAATPPPIPQRAQTPVPVAPSRTATAERKSASGVVRTNLPPAPPTADEIDPPTDPDVDSGAIHAALVGLSPKNSTVGSGAVREPMAQLDSAPEISIGLDADGPDAARTRSKHDTDIAIPTDLVTDHRAATLSDGIPGAINAAPSGAVRGTGESIPPLPPPPDRKTGERAPALGAAALPPARPVTRPPSRQAMTPPPVMSRPVADSDRSDAVEVYAPAPPSTEAPPGERAERPGQYAQHKRPSSTKLPVDVIKGPPDRSGPTAIPSGLGRPVRQSSGMPAIQQPRAQTPSSQPPTQARAGSSSQTPAAPRAAAPSPGTQPRMQPPSQPPAPQPSRTTTPSRVSPPGAPAARGSSGSGVVMTRPAVIVGAPAKPSNPPRVRKAREDEGRGFGQGLISEKSLDEVILAYLSEDADDK